jgi:ribosomal protein L19
MRLRRHFNGHSETMWLKRNINGVNYEIEFPILSESKVLKGHCVEDNYSIGEL